jgi:putative restriction endonuclease
MASTVGTTSLLDRIAGIRRYTKGEFTAPNKPVTLLWALARVEEGKPRLTPFAAAEPELRPLLDTYGTRGTSALHAYWALRNDGFWEVVAGGDLVQRRQSQEPTLDSFRQHASGGFRQEAFEALAESKGLRRDAVALLLKQLRANPSARSFDPPPTGARQTVERLYRHAAFRQGVLAAFGSRCVVCGWGVRSQGRTVAVAAAHIHPLEAQGPDAPGNGIAICFHHHALFDAGLFSYDEDRRVVVSTAWEDEKRGAMPSLEDHAGAPLPESLDPAWKVRDKHLTWHRENVFLG